MADQLASPSDLAALLQTDVDTASATLAIEVATSVVQAAAGQRLVLVTDESETVYGATDRVLALSQRPVVSVTSVTFNSVLLTQGTASGTWRLTPGGLWRDLGWAECSWVGGSWVGGSWAERSWGPAPAPPTVVVYTHGYAAGAQELQLARGATLSIARGLFNNPTGATSEKIDDYSVAYAEAAAALDASPGLAARLRKQYGTKAGMVRVL